LRRTSRLVLLAGVFLAAITFIVIVLLFQSGPCTGPNCVPTASTPTTADVLVASVDIPLGTTITADMVSKQTVSVGSVLSGGFHDPSQIIGQPTTSAITAGAQITASDFTQTSNPHPDPGKGNRAFAITVNELTGVGNLVRTGDHVDVLISQNVTVVQKNPDGTVATVPGVGNALTVKMPLLLENIQVISVIDSAATAPAAPAQGQQPAASTAPILTGGTKLLILSVTPAQAEVLLFARTSGTIDVVYRNTDDTDQVATDGVILKTLIDKYGVIPPTVIITQIP
jgi:pilus assembly protein CpaB